MFLRMFDSNGRIAPLSMSGAGDAAAAGGAGGAGAGGAPAAGTVLTFDSSKPFIEQLPEKYRSDANFRDIKSVDGLLDGYVNAQKMVGADKIARPKDGDAQGWDSFYNSMGRPESADKYNIGKRADGTDYGEPDKAFQAKMLPALHKAGITQQQLDAIRPEFDGLMAEASGAGTKAAQAYADEQNAGLKAKYGDKLGDLQTDALAALRHYGGKDADALITQLNIVKDGKATGDNALLMELLGKLGGKLREDGVLKGDGGAPLTGAMAPGDAKARIEALQKDPAFVKVWKTKGSSGQIDGKTMTNADALAEMARLYSAAYPPADAA